MSRNPTPVSLSVPGALAPSPSSHSVAGGQIFTYKAPGEFLLTHLTMPGWNHFGHIRLTGYTVWSQEGPRFAFDLSVVLCLSWRNSVMQEKYSVVWWQELHRHIWMPSLLFHSFSEQTIPECRPSARHCSKPQGDNGEQWWTEKSLPSWSLHFSGRRLAINKYNWPLNSTGLNCVGPLYTDCFQSILSYPQSFTFMDSTNCELKTVFSTYGWESTDAEGRLYV